MSRNAGEQQRKIRLQVEQLLINRDKANEVLSVFNNMKRQRLLKRKLDGKDFVAENREDARVWRDLDSYVRNHTQEVHRERLQSTRIKHMEIMDQHRQDAQNALSKQETTRKIRDHILGVCWERKERGERLRQVVALHLASVYVTSLWKIGTKTSRRRADARRK